MHYFSFNIPDYRAKTGHLSDDEDLAYRRMTEEYYLNESPFVDDIQAIARKIRMPTKASAVETVLKEFFYLAKDGMWHKNRCDNAIEKYHSMSKGGKKGATKRWDNNNLDSPPIATPSTPQCQPLTTNQESITNVIDSTPTPKGEETQKQQPKPKEKKDGSKTLIPADFQPDENARRLASELGVDVNACLGEFLDWCRSKRPMYADWQATFRNSLRRYAANHGRGQGRATSGRPEPQGVVAAALRVAARRQGAA